MAQFSGAKELTDAGIKLYKYTQVNPKDPCPICKKISEETMAKPIPINKMFRHGEVEAMYSPFHVNCLCSVIITQTKDSKD